MEGKGTQCIPTKWANSKLEEDSVEDCRVINFIPQQKFNLIITECSNGPLPNKKRYTEFALGLFEQGLFGVVADLNNM